MPDNLNEQLPVDGPENLPAAPEPETVNWEEKYKQSENDWQKKWSEKDRSYNETAEKLKAFEKHSSTLDQISTILSQKKQEKEAEAVKNGDVGFLREELDAKMERLLAEKIAPLEQQRAQVEQELFVSNIQSDLTKAFVGQEKYADYAKAILTETLNNEGEAAFWALTQNSARLLKLAKGDWLDDQEKQTSEKNIARQNNATNHRKTMAPTSRSGVASENKSSAAYKNMSIDELEKEWIRAGGTPINIK